MEENWYKKCFGGIPSIWPSLVTSKTLSPRWLANFFVGGSSPEKIIFCSKKTVEFRRKMFEVKWFFVGFCVRKESFFLCKQVKSHFIDLSGDKKSFTFYRIV